MPLFKKLSQSTLEVIIIRDLKEKLKENRVIPSVKMRTGPAGATPPLPLSMHAVPFDRQAEDR